MEPVEFDDLRMDYGSLEGKADNGWISGGDPDQISESDGLLDHSGATSCTK